MTNQENNHQMKDSSRQAQNPIYTLPPDDEINFIGLFRILIEQKWLILVLTVLATFVALVIALQATPIYRAEVLLAHVEKGKDSRFSALAGQLGGLASLAGLNTESGGDVEEAIATLKSRNFTYKLIKDENLMQVFFEDAWDEKSKQWFDVDKPPTMWKAYEKFDSIRSVTLDSNTGLYTLSIDWKDPEIAAEWANKLVTRINNKLRHEAISNAEKSVKYLEAELQKTSIIELKESIYSLIEAQTKTKMLANTREEYAFHVIDSAVVPEQKINSRRIIVILGFLIGGFVGVLSAFIRHYFKNNS